jgi:LasA protease
MQCLGKGKNGVIVAICLALFYVTVACAIARPAKLMMVSMSQPDYANDLPTSTSRPVYSPGELVAYTAQSGDNLPMLAARFNTTEETIRKTNPILPPAVTTLPQGLPMQIPIYYTPFWGSAFKLIPNSAFIYSSDLEDYEIDTMLVGNPRNSKAIQQITALEGMPEAFRQTCLQASVDPRLVLSLIEYGLDPNSGLQPASKALLNSVSVYNLDLLQHWLNLLNEGYYGFEIGKLVKLELPDGSIEGLDPWQNAASAGISYFFSQMLETPTDYQRALNPSGFAATYENLFGNPWAAETEVLPGSLEWIPAGLPINPQGGWQAALLTEAISKSMSWSGATAGFHASIQDATDKNVYGKVFSSIGGTITRLDASQLVVSQPGMPETQGWSIVYFGLAVKPGLKVGDKVQIGETLGHVDAGAWDASFWLARKYNGEWVPAGSVVPFTLGGWKLVLDADGRNLVMHKPELSIYSQPYKGQTNLIPNQ